MRQPLLISLLIARAIAQVLRQYNRMPPQGFGQRQGLGFGSQGNPRPKLTTQTGQVMGGSQVPAGGGYRGGMPGGGMSSGGMRGGMSGGPMQGGMRPGQAPGSNFRGGPPQSQGRYPGQGGAQNSRPPTKMVRYDPYADPYEDNYEEYDDYRMSENDF